ncbi:MAG: tetratricopeptide repeat protein [Balneolaceae bacterium]|nr:tetratricopeptide repeat protein [Balneolaceae bacterium]
MGIKLSKYGKAGLTITALGVTAFTGVPATTILGLSPELIGSFKDIFQDVNTNIFAKHLIEAVEKDPDIEKAYEEALVETLDAVKKEFYEDQKLIETFSLQLKAKLEGIPSEKIVNRNSMKEKFFKPLEEALKEDKVIKRIFEENKQLELGNLVQKIIKENNTVSFPSFIDSDEKKNQVIKIFSDQFNKRFLENFKKQLTQNKKARTLYHTYLLHSAFQLLETLEEGQVDIKEHIIRLKDFAIYQSYDLDRLLAGNDTIKKLLKENQEKINEIREKLEETNKPLLKCYAKKKTDKRDQLKYQSLYSDFVGREEELELLRGFIEKNQIICWYMIEGAGGSGKSRLANEFCLKVQEINWEAGFYSFDDNVNFSWKDFKPTQKTLIVFDYVQTQNNASKVNTILELLSAKEDTYSKKIRVLLIDREFEEKTIDELNTVNTRDKYYSYTLHEQNEPHKLSKLEDEARWAIMSQMFKGSKKDQELLEKKEILMNFLDQQDPLKRPLFALFSGIALAEGEDISDWNTNDNLKYHIKRLEKKFWSQNSLWEEGYENDIKNIIWLATICVFLTTEDIEEIKNGFSNIITFDISTKRFEQLNELFGSTNFTKESRINYLGIKPELLAEFFIIEYLREVYQRPGSGSQEMPIKLQDAAWRIRPELVWWMTYLTAKNYNGEDNFKQIEKFIEQYQNGSNFGNLLNNLAVLYSDQNEKNKAELYFLKAIEHKHTDAIFNLAKMFRKEGDFTKAEKYYLQAIENGDVIAVNDLGNLYKEYDLDKKAEKYYQQSIDQGYSASINNLANLYREQGKHEKAEEYYKKAIDEGVVEALNGLAVLYQTQDNIENAIKYYEKAVAKGNVQAQFNLAVLYTSQNELGKAEEHYLQAINKGHTEAYANLAYLYHGQGNISKAKLYYLEAIDHGSTKAFNYLGKLYYQEGDQKKAEEYFHKGINNNHFDFLGDLVNLLKMQGRTEEALKFLEKAIENEYQPAYLTKANLFYENNINKSSALELIEIKEKKWGLTLKEKAFKNILYVWSGDLQKFDQNKDKVINQILKEEPSLLEIFVRDLLVHYQCPWLLDRIKDEAVANTIRKYAKIAYFLIHYFANSNDDILNEAPEEFEEKFEKAKEYIRSKREFYYNG